MDNKQLTIYANELMKARADAVTLLANYGDRYDKGAIHAYDDALAWLYIYSGGEFGVERPKVGA